jgi:hypothetical protein
MVEIFRLIKDIGEYGRRSRSSLLTIILLKESFEIWFMYEIVATSYKYSHPYSY